MNLSALGVIHDSVKQNVASQIAVIGVSDPGLTAEGIAALAAIAESVALIPSALQLRQDPPVRGE